MKNQKKQKQNIHVNITVVINNAKMWVETKS